MKIYRVTKWTESGESAGYAYFLKKSEANECQKKHGSEDIPISETEISMNKWDVVNALNRFGSHPDNG